MVFLLIGCQEKVKTTTACVGVEQGILVNQELVAIDDRITSAVITNTYPFELYQIDNKNESQVKLLVDSLEDQLYMDKFEGYQCEISQDSTGITVKVEVDYVLADMNKLREIGLISGSSDEVSLKLTVNNLEKVGLSCHNN